MSYEHCGECELGLGSHNTRSPRCDHYEPPAPKPRWQVRQHSDDPRFYLITDQAGRPVGLASSHAIAMESADILARNSKTWSTR